MVHDAMQVRKRSNILLRMSLMLSLLALQELAYAEHFPPLDIQGMSYPSACAPSEWQGLGASLRSVAGQRNPAELVSLVRTYLCASGVLADARLHRSMPARILSVAEATGETRIARRYLESKTLTTLGGKAWGAIADSDEKSVWLSYFPNEACSTTAIFSYRRGNWQWLQLNEACD